MDFVNSKYKSPVSQVSPSKPTGKTMDVKHMSIGHNRAEMYINLGEAVILLAPSAAKKMMTDLQEAVTAWEKVNGTIKPDSDRKRKGSESTAKKALKSLYKSRRVTSKLLSINTSRKKHIPPKSD